MTPQQLAARIDHTLLRPEAIAADVRALVDVAAAHGCASACVQSSRAGVAVAHANGGVPVAAVLGFPHGTVQSAAKAAEAAALAELGVTDIDMVVDLGAVADGDLAAVGADIAGVRAAAPTVVLKVILETAVWDADTITALCRVSVEQGADFVKTSTGFHPAGGASLDAVRAMRAAVGDAARVKASGGIRDLATAEAMIEAGADRLGLSATESILGEFTG